MVSGRRVTIMIFVLRYPRFVEQETPSVRPGAHPIPHAAPGMLSNMAGLFGLEMITQAVFVANNPISGRIDKQEDQMPKRKAPEIETIC